MIPNALLAFNSVPLTIKTSNKLTLIHRCNSSWLSITCSQALPSSKVASFSEQNMSETRGFYRAVRAKKNQKWQKAHNKAKHLPQLPKTLEFHSQTAYYTTRAWHRVTLLSLNCSQSMVSFQGKHANNQKNPTFHLQRIQLIQNYGAIASKAGLFIYLWSFNSLRTQRGQDLSHWSDTFSAQLADSRHLLAAKTHKESDQV